MSDDATPSLTDFEQALVHDTWNQSRTSEELQNFVERRWLACPEEL